MELLKKLILVSRWPKYTLLEVKENKKNNWIVIDDHVLDVTKYMSKHPMGSRIIWEHCGTDASISFDRVSHSDAAYKTMLEYKIGNLLKI